MTLGFGGWIDPETDPARSPAEFLAGLRAPLEAEWVQCEHHWVHHHQGDMPIWIPRCSQCGHFNGTDIAEQIAALGSRA